MNACGLDMSSAVMKETEFYVSHEVGADGRGWLGRWGAGGRLDLLACCFFTSPAVCLPIHNTHAR